MVGVGEKHDLVSKLRRIQDQYPLSLTVAIGDESHFTCMASALDAGANAALCASVTRSGLVGALHAIMSGGIIAIDARLWPSRIQPKIVETASLPIGNPPAPETNPPAPETENEPLAAGKQLSAREIAILERIVRGDSNKHVARFFEISEATVKAHVKAIFQKIGANNRTQAAIWALNHGFFESLNGVADHISVLPVGKADARSKSQITVIPHRPSLVSRLNRNV